jgi:flavodoxin
MGNQEKKLVVYYSLEGSTAFIAKAIAEAIGADLLELKPEKSIKSKGFMKFFLAGMQVFMKKKPKLLPLEKNLADYDLLFLGTPIWAGNYNPAFRTFFSTTSLKGKKIALFCSCADTGKKAFENMKQELPGNTIIGENEFRLPLKDADNNAKKAAEWAKEVMSESK